MKTYYWIDLSGISLGMVFLAKVQLSEESIEARKATLSEDTTLLEKEILGVDCLVLIETPFFMVGFDNYLNHLVKNYVRDLDQPTLFELISDDLGDCNCN